MDKEDLAALAPDIDLAILKYEAGLIKTIAKANPAQVEVYATSMHVSPLMQAEFTLSVFDAASKTQEELYAIHAQEVSELENDQKEETTNKSQMEVQNYFDLDCETVDPNNEWYAPGKAEYGKAHSLKGPKIVDPYKVTFESNLFKDLNKYYLEDLGSEKTAEDCFNCDVTFKLETTYPGIEFAWEFGKIIQAIKDFIKLVETNLDPTMIYNQLCNFKLFVGKNWMCPANMQNLSLMLPALFMKYSLDLGKLSFDLNWILGGMIKAIFSTIATFLENIRSIIMPFINCYINGVNATFGYVKSIVMAAAKMTDSVVDAVDRAVGAVHKAIAQIGDVLFISDSEENEAEMKKQEAELNKLLQELQETKDVIRDGALYSAGMNKKAKELDDSIASLKKIRRATKLLNWIFQNEKKYIQDQTRKELERHEFEKAFNDYFKKHKVVRDGTEYTTVLEQYNLVLSLKKEKKRNEISIKRLKKNVKKILTDKIAPHTQRSEEIKAKIKTLEAKQARLTEDLYQKISVEKNTFVNSAEAFIENPNTNFFKQMPTPKLKTGTTVNLNKYAIAPLQEMERFLTNRYGIQASNQYMKTEYFGTLRKAMKTGETVALSGIESLRKWLVKPAEDLKAFINDFIGNVINALRNLSVLFDQGAMAEIKLLGELLQLTHLVRLIRVIIKMVNEGINGCEQIKDSQSQKEALKDILEKSNSNIEVVLSSEADSETAVSDKTIARIYSKNNKYQHLLNYKDCGELSKHLEKENPSLDDIYSNLKRALI